MLLKMLIVNGKNVSIKSAKNILDKYELFSFSFVALTTFSKIGIFLKEEKSCLTILLPTSPSWIDLVRYYSKFGRENIVK